MTRAGGGLLGEANGELVETLGSDTGVLAVRVTSGTGGSGGDTTVGVSFDFRSCVFD
jgi:hypothetical protein